MVGIYLLTSPSGKHYIGQSINIKRRFSEYRRLKCKKQTILYNSLVKYGFENFSVTILEECPRERLPELEKYYIEKYNCLAPNGYNCTTGGENYVFSEKSKENCRRAIIRKWEKDIPTYNEPILILDKEYNLLCRYDNIEEAAIDLRISAPDIYYNTFGVSKDKNVIMILENANYIENSFYNVDCLLIKIYEEIYKNGIDKILKLCKQ